MTGITVAASNSKHLQW